jgi:DNA phosphorothioation-dependent restriction protein DptH
LRRTLTSQPTWDDVRRDFSGPSTTRQPALATSQSTRATPTTSEPREVAPDAVIAPPSAESLTPGEGAPEQPTAAQEGTAPLANLPRPPEDAEWSPSAVLSGPEVDVLVGDNRVTSQYGLLGVVAAEPFRRVGLDLDGCNTISVFGVQGGGKSYTLGSVLEMAVRQIDGINALPSPLGAVVFHYHQTQDYPPEFVSMTAPNDEPSEVAALAVYGAAPTRLEDLVVLTPSDMVERRRAEFPGVPIEPIKFSSSELSIGDWRFLMGASGNDSLYLKVLNQAMQGTRRNLTLETIRAALSHAPMNDSQRALATTRLELAARFIDDARSLRSLLHPGGVVVVDLRDEFIERDEALGLFVSMLNVFAGAGMDQVPFNKVIVFDEAHKYMGGALIGQVVEVIREMRHKGVSVVVASQDPVNVPQAIVELSSAVVLHRFNSPNWLKHIQRSLASLSDLTPSMLSSLATGEAFMWANRATDPVFTRRAVKVRMRPRATKHGGSTRKAVP